MIGREHQRRFNYFLRTVRDITNSSPHDDERRNKNKLFPVVKYLWKLNMWVLASIFILRTWSICLFSCIQPGVCVCKWTLIAARNLMIYVLNLEPSFGSNFFCQPSKLFWLNTLAFFANSGDVYFKVLSANKPSRGRRKMPAMAFLVIPIQIGDGPRRDHQHGGAVHSTLPWRRGSPGGCSSGTSSPTPSCRHSRTTGGPDCKAAVAAACTCVATPCTGGNR